jgi:hypothetical protein
MNHDILLSPVGDRFSVLHVPSLITFVAQVMESEVEGDTEFLFDFADYLEANEGRLFLTHEHIRQLQGAAKERSIVPPAFKVSVSLTQEELYTCSIIGARRQIESLMDGREDQHGFDGYNGWTVHIEGVCGELAVAKYLNIHYGFHVNTFKTGRDVGICEVRTRSEHHYDLLVRPNDADERPFVHLTGRAPQYVLRGWLWGHEAKQKKFAKNYGGRPSAFFVPQEHLRPMEELWELTHADLRI